MAKSYQICCPNATTIKTFIVIAKINMGTRNIFAAPAKAQVNFAIVDSTNMYNSDNQRLLFPFVQ